MMSRLTAAVIALALMMPAWAKDEPTTADNVQKGAKSVVNEIGKGFEAVGKAVGPAVGKAEKSVRGGAKDNSEKRDTDKK